tara:strand:- start:4516 stop:5559 length:1044 start_codon:yes stop_codon:yes gene_type:complete
MRTVFALALLLAQPALAEDPLWVEVATVHAMQDSRTLVIVGEMVARNTFSPSFPAGGRIAEVAVQEGDVVGVGAVLARMDAVQQTQALRVAEAGLTRAQADYSQAVRDLERQVALLERGATTRIARDSAEDAQNIALGALTQAEAEMSRAQRDLNDTVLRASSAATVIKRNVEPGQVVGAAQQVLELALGTEMDAVFEVPEALLTQRSDPNIGLNLLHQPSETFFGTVREVSPLIDQRTGTVRVTVSVTDLPQGATYGDAVRGTTQTAPTQSVALPYTAMMAYQKGAAVWVVDPASSTVSLKPITLDRFETGDIILKSGVNEGDIVVTKGAQLLYPGRIVTFEKDVK